MSDTLPKNVEAFINKYGRRGSREQDAAFWKDFRKAANAYADTQAYRLQELQATVARVTAELDELLADVHQPELCDETIMGLRIDLAEVKQQRDRLAEAARRVVPSDHAYDTAQLDGLRQALAAVKGGGV